MFAYIRTKKSTPIKRSNTHWVCNYCILLFIPFHLRLFHLFCLCFFLFVFFVYFFWVSFFFLFWPFEKTLPASIIMRGRPERCEPETEYVEFTTMQKLRCCWLILFECFLFLISFFLMSASCAVHTLKTKRTSLFLVCSKKVSSPIEICGHIFFLYFSFH